MGSNREKSNIAITILEKNGKQTWDTGQEILEEDWNLGIILYWYVQSTKILLLPPKYEIIMLPSNHSVFQYCDSNFGLFSIATTCKVITLNPFWYQFFASFLMALSLKLSLFQLSRYQ